MKMKPKMLIGSTVLTVVAVLLTTIGVVTVTNDLATESLQKEVTNRLIVQRDTQKDSIESYFTQVNAEVSQQATLDGVFANALNEFTVAFPRFKDDALKGARSYKKNVKAYYDEQFGARYLQRNEQNTVISSDDQLATLNSNAIALQYYFIAQNPHPLGEKQKLVKPSQIENDYTRAHAKYHPRFTEYLNRHGFYDVFLVDVESGDLVYSVFKELDFATSLTSGPYAKSGIGQAFKLAKQATKPGQTFTTDMQSYYPSYNDYASFVSAPIFINGKLKGVFIIQMPLDKINQLMTFNQKWAEYGLGASGETYIVADDKTMRNDSRFLIEDEEGYFQALREAKFPETVLSAIAKKATSIGVQEVDSPGVQAGLAGEKGFDIFPDYRNVPVLSAYTPLNIAGLNWVLLAEIDEAEAFAAVAAMTDSIIKTAIGIGIVVLLMGLAASLFFVNTIVSPISHFKQIMGRFTEGDADARVKLETDDEIGDLATAFDNLLDEREKTLAKIQKDNDSLNDSIIEMLQVAAQMSQGDLTVKMVVSENVTGPLADSLNLVTERTGDVIKQVRNTALDVDAAASSVKDQSNTVRKVSEQELAVVNATVDDLSKASKELNNIVVLAKQCSETADETITITDSAQKSVNDSVQGINKVRDFIRETEKRIKRLGERSQEIGGVVDLINGIAEKTHVLALNASMQAASAGEAGRGFAVVANEVQRLAENAREATLEIRQQVKNIQIDTADTVTAMNKAISQVVEGSQMAEKSGEQMNATRDKSYELVSLVQQISERSEAQAKVALTLEKQAAEIKNTNAQTFEQMNGQVVHTEQLVKSAARLLEVINEFKVIGQDDAPVASVINS